MKNFLILHLIFQYLISQIYSQSNISNHVPFTISRTTLATSHNTTLNATWYRPFKKDGDDDEISKGAMLAILLCTIFVPIIIAIIVVIICRCCKKKKNKMQNDSNIQIINDNPQYIKIMNENKNKIDNLLKGDLSPKLYNQENNINNKCSICNENFKKYESEIGTLKCGHIFHFLCIKNLMFKDIICPKCPICNYLILGQENEKIPKDIFPEISGQNLKTDNSNIKISSNIA